MGAVQVLVHLPDQTTRQQAFVIGRAVGEAGESLKEHLAWFDWAVGGVTTFDAVPTTTATSPPASRAARAAAARLTGDAPTQKMGPPISMAILALTTLSLPGAVATTTMTSQQHSQSSVQTPW